MYVGGVFKQSVVGWIGGGCSWMSRLITHLNIVLVPEGVFVLSLKKRQVNIISTSSIIELQCTNLIIHENKLLTFE